MIYAQAWSDEMDGVTKKDIVARARGWLYAIFCHNVRGTWSLTRQEILFWQHCSKVETCEVPWWILGEEHKTELVAMYLASAGKMNHTGIVAQLLCAPVAGLALVYGDVPVGHQVAQTGSVDAMRVLLRAGADVRTKDIMNQSMLHVAASFSQLGMLSVLLKAGADSRATDSKGCTPLHLIGKCRGDNRADSVEIAFCLIESGASTTCRDAEGRQPLEEALYRSNVMLALVILEGKRHSKPRTFQEQGPILLHKAVRLGYLGAVNELVKEGFNMNTQDESGLTPLLTAVIRGHCDIVEVLLRHRVYTTVFTAGGQTALHIAIDRSRLDIISVLLRGGALTSIRNAQGFTALYHAVRQGRGIGEATVVQALLNGGASVCEGGIKRLTALHLAVQAGHTKCVRLLLDAGATPGHCRNEEGVSPLFLAIRQGYTPIANLLIPRLTDRQIEMHHTNSGNTALTLAIHKQHREVVRELLEGGANPNTHALSGNHPLTIAVRAPSNRGSASIVRYLLEAGADPNMFSVDGIPVLHDACIAGGDGEIADLLLEAGVGVNSPCPGRDFLTPLHIAAIHGSVAIVRELIKVNTCKLDVQAPTPTRATPLAIAVDGGHCDVVRELLEAGADIHAVPRNTRGEQHVDSLISLATGNGHVDVTNLLIQAWAMNEKLNEARES